MEYQENSVFVKYFHITCTQLFILACISGKCELIQENLPYVAYCPTALKFTFNTQLRSKLVIQKCTVSTRLPHPNHF